MISSVNSSRSTILVEIYSKTLFGGTVYIYHPGENSVCVLHSLCLRC